MMSREPLTSGRVTHQGVAQVLLEQEERRIRQGMRVNQESWRKDHGLKRTVWPRNVRSFWLVASFWAGRVPGSGIADL